MKVERNKQEEGLNNGPATRTRFKMDLKPNQPEQRQKSGLSPYGEKRSEQQEVLHIEQTERCRGTLPLDMWPTNQWGWLSKEKVGLQLTLKALGCWAYRGNFGFRVWSPEDSEFLRLKPRQGSG